MSSRLAIAALLTTAGIAGFGFTVQGGQGKKPKAEGQERPRSREYPAPTAGWKMGTILLGCPTRNSIDFALHLTKDAEAFIQYGPAGSEPNSKSPTFKVLANTAFQGKLENLKANTAYTYRLKCKPAGKDEFVESPDYRFQTQRTTGASYTFFVQGDSHPERVPKMHIPSLYERTLLTAAAQKPDFFICLGDDFSVDTLKDRTKEAIEGVYTKQVPYLGLVANSAPLYLVNGNHEQAARANLDGTADSLGVLVQNARNRNFPQPAPDGFYTGNGEKVEHIGLLRNYFAWTWGDALFVTIDPYWHSEAAVDNALGKGPKNEGGGKRNRNLWDITLGETQSKWLAKTLSESKAKYKFVFAHHVSGTGRGGVEQAPFYEWGGKDRNGTDQFRSKRPGWEDPIHKLFVKNGVSVFFQGHDHIFCKQELDGVIYQTCPCPADPTNSLINGDAYATGDKVPGAGLVRVTVGTDQTKIDYVRAFEPTAEKDGHKHGEIAYSYTVQPRKN